MAAKKNIIGVYLATWWALQNVFKLNLKQQLVNAFARAVSVMMLMNPFLRSIELVNETDSDIEFFVNQCYEKKKFMPTLNAQKSRKIKKEEFKKYITPVTPTTVIIEATNEKYKSMPPTLRLPPEHFTDYNKLVFNIVKEGLYVSKH